VSPSSSFSAAVRTARSDIRSSIASTMSSAKLVRDFFWNAR
jgi:hypothetical protein